jgi:hypothetical protein
MLRITRLFNVMSSYIIGCWPCQVSAKLYAEVIDELAADLCSAEHSAATQQLEQQVEALLKQAYPVTSSLPKSELRKRLKEARALEEQKYRSSNRRTGGNDTDMELPPDENAASGVFGRQLSLVCLCMSSTSATVLSPHLPPPFSFASVNHNLAKLQYTLLIFITPFPNLSISG